MYDILTMLIAEATRDSSLDLPTLQILQERLDKAQEKDIIDQSELIELMAKEVQTGIVCRNVV